MDWDGLQEILLSLKKNKLRTLLTAFGVFWGIFMLILLLGAGQGLRNGAESGLGSDDRSSIWISSSQTSTPYKGKPHGRTIEFTEDDISSLKNAFKSIQHISAENMAGSRWRQTINVSHKDKTASYRVFGVADDYFKIKRFLEYPAGRTINPLDASSLRKVAIIGTAVRDRLFDTGEDPVGQQIQFHGILLTVVGVFYDDGNEGRMSERVYIPLSTFQKVFGKGNTVGLITLTPKAGADPYQLEKDVIAHLQHRHDVSPNDRKAISAFNLAEQTRSMTNLFSAINGFIWFVGLGTLMAGIVGISNIMIITVKDRTKEIGIRKALGAKPFSIVNMILTESILITSLAGYLGLVAGVGLLELTQTLLTDDSGFFQRPEVDFQTALLALAILILSGTLAGLAPALRASKILPIEAMREE